MYSSHIINSQLLLLDAMFVKSFISMIPIIQPKYSNTSPFYIIFHSKPKQKVVQHTKTHTCNGDYRLGIHWLGFHYIRVLYFSLIWVGSGLLFTAWELSGYGFFFFFWKIWRNVAAIGPFIKPKCWSKMTPKRKYCSY